MEPIRADQVQAILAKVAEETGLSFIAAKVEFRYRRRPDGEASLEQEFLVSVVEEPVFESSLESLSDAAEKTIAAFKYWQAA